ncbi:MAG: UDP-4-amino-4,6-dideoxy-N-acetyl-beta-L-altrosamine transaminase [Hydrogenophilaceae bacterium]|nr:UDP-4-amino-4,6-dideoxy-N-acetyl-beta-L-altrosamine transaminase [Hydrogenophilaceae bacterium]
MSFIPYGRQDINAADVAAVVEVLESDWLTQGPAIERFERAIADYCGAAHGVAVNSATSALHIACLALGLGPGKRLWTSPNTFVASANCGLYCGAEVDFVDIEFATGNLSVAALAEKLQQAERRGSLPDVLVPVHFAGQPCDMPAIRNLADRYGFRIIEDASHAIGARYGDERVGCGRYADITVFSFHPVKIITTGEGGMALTNSADLATKMRRLRSHGITREAVEMECPSEGAWYYQQIELGFNYRITDIQAALGLSQLQRLEAFVARRSQLAARYDRLLADLPLGRPAMQPPMASAWHLYVVHLAEGSRRPVFDAMRAQGIGVNVHYIPVHLQPYYRKRGFRPGDFPEAERHYAAALSLPLFAALSEVEQDRVVTVLREAMGAAA